MKQNGSIVKEKVFLYGLYEKITGGGVTKEHHFVPGPAGVAAIYEKTSTSSSMFYVHTDHLGSVDVITNSSGAVVERMAFDPWGQRRNATDWTFSNVAEPVITERGYTMHEHLDMFGLINMNGRTYNPLLARFTGADPIIQSPANMQNFNSYSYVLNNPLMYTDPSGYQTAPLSYSEPFSSSGFEFFEWGNGGGGSGSMGYSYDKYTKEYTDIATGQVVDWQTAVYGSYKKYGGRFGSPSEEHISLIAAYLNIVNYHWSARSTVITDSETGFQYMGWETIRTWKSIDFELGYIPMRHVIPISDMTNFSHPAYDLFSFHKVECTNYKLLEAEFKALKGVMAGGKLKILGFGAEAKAGFVIDHFSVSYSAAGRQINRNANTRLTAGIGAGPLGINVSKGLISNQGSDIVGNFAFMEAGLDQNGGKYATTLLDFSSFNGLTGGAFTLKLNLGPSMNVQSRDNYRVRIDNTFYGY